MRTKDKKNNIKKVNLLIEMRSQLINENPPYHMDMGDPVTAGKAQYGYLEGDSPELIGKEVWCLWKIKKREERYYTRNYWIHQ